MSALGVLLDAVYGGCRKCDDDGEQLRAIADWLDKIDDVTDGLLADKGSDHRVMRFIQEDLRRISKRLDQ